MNSAALGLRHALSALTLGGALSAPLACSSNEISIADYDRSCTVDSDCVLAGEGDACCCLSCNTAINVAERGRYLNDVEQASEGCDTLCDCGPCNSEAFCDAGTCRARDRM